MSSISVGLKGRVDAVVTNENIAVMGNERLPVFATPYMIGMMELAASNAVQPYLEEDQSTVGAHLDVSHEAATPVGMKVWAEAELTAVDGRKLVFSITAYDEAGLIGQGTHERFIITTSKFLAKTRAKLG